jgi:hypothetical protein
LTGTTRNFKLFLAGGAPAIARVTIAAFAFGAFAWVASAAPKFWAEVVIVQIVPHVLAGETYQTKVLDHLAMQEDHTKQIRPSTLSKIAIIDLRRTEEAIASGAVDNIDPMLDHLRDETSNSLANAPNDPFLWLVLFWLDNTRYGFADQHLGYLRMSYSLGPNEAWISTRRNRFALAIFPALSADLAEAAIEEFAGLVRSQRYVEAANIVAGPGRPIRQTLLARLNDLKGPDRRRFARLLEDRDVDDASSILGVERH